MRNSLKRQEGMALLLATALVGIAVVVVGTLAVRMVNASHQTDHFVAYEECMYGLETGLAQSQNALESGEDGYVGVDADLHVNTAPAFLATPFLNANVTPLTLNDLPGVSYYAYARNWVNDGLDNDGDGAVDNLAERGRFTVYAAAQNGASVRRVEEVLKGIDVNVWRNAIFAGSGQAGGLINGNVSVAGSVHLLGNNLLTGTTAINALDLSGTSLIHNNYNQLPASLASCIPPLPTRSFGGETVSTIDATLRVKKGLVGTSGNSEIGEPNIAGNTVKETMDAVYVNDGYNGTSVTSDGGRGDPTHLYSDNGWDNLYDLGDKVPLPILTDLWRDPMTGATVYDPSRAANYTHQQYFDEVLVGDPSNRTDGLYTGNITIRANANFYYNASRPSDTNPAHRVAGDDYIYYNSATNVMEINGQVSINGSLTITRGGGNQRTIYYTGRAAILVHGNVTLDTDLFSKNPDGTTANSYPVRNCFGIMASGDMTVGSLSQLTLMGAFYAQGKIACSKQTTVLGTFVSNYFDMGTNVPSIFQVPSLADNLPYGMIGAYPILAFTQVAWRELGV